MAVGGCVRRDRSHSYLRCPEGDRNAQKSARDQAPRGQVRLAEKKKPWSYKEAAGIGQDQESERQRIGNHVY